jgi:two-component system, cell cycle response regulator
MLDVDRGLVQSTGETTARHSETVAELSLAVADELDLDGPARGLLDAAALLHDVGKAELPEALLGKRGPLTEDERRLVETHTILGERLLIRADPGMAPVARLVRSCHERWDGAGYPDGLAGEEIPLTARVVFCCDAYEAMTSDRPYRRAIGHSRALRELWANSGTQFDPAVVQAVGRALARRAPVGADAGVTVIRPPAPRASARATSV